MIYRIERWSARGITTTEAATKREANKIAEQLRADPTVTHTAVIFPNDKVRLCRNTKAKVTK